MFAPFWTGMITLVIATRNEHKVGEIQVILGPPFQCLPLLDFPGAPDVVEDAPTFSGNAVKKSRELAAWLSQAPQKFLGPSGKAGKTFVLADDSGLEVDALGGAPGVHSARFAAFESGMAGNSPTAENNAKLLRLLVTVPAGRRTARFRCVLALTPVSLGTCSTELFEGACEGRIEHGPRGQGGFGYDPLFTPEGFQQTFAELGEKVKNGLSHRARALAALKRHLAVQ